MTADALAALEALVAKMTPEPWKAARLSDCRDVESTIAYIRRCLAAGLNAEAPDFYAVLCEKPDGRADVAHLGNGPTSADNTVGIVALRNAAPALIALARDAEGARKDLATARRVVEAARLMRSLVKGNRSVQEAYFDSGIVEALQSMDDACLLATSGAKWEPKGAAHGVEAGGERPFTPYVISRFDLAQLRHLYPQVKAYNPDLADGLLARVIANIEKTYVADEPRVEAKPAPPSPSHDAKGEGESSPARESANKEGGDDNCSPVPSATGSITMPPDAQREASHDARGDDSAAAGSSKGEGEKGVEGDVAFRFVDDVVTPIFDKRGHTYDSLAVKEQLRAAIKAAVDEAVRAAYARGVEAEAKRRERMGL